MSNPEPTITPEQEQPKTTEEHPHPKKGHKDHIDHSVPTIHHEHAVIHPASTGVTHVNPGAIVI